MISAIRLLQGIQGLGLYCENCQMIQESVEITRKLIKVNIFEDIMLSATNEVITICFGCSGN